MAFEGKPEHPGRVRGVGKGIGIKKYFGDSATRQKRQKSEQEIHEEFMRSMAHRWEEVRKEHGDNIDPTQIPDMLSEFFSSFYRPPPAVEVNLALAILFIKLFWH